jgi:hypothetical protein
VKAALWGGYEGAERCVAAFYTGDAPEMWEWPVLALRLQWNGKFANPGDSLDLPPTKVTALCVALVAPWLKTHEAVDYINQVKPEFVIPIHDAIASSMGKMIYRNAFRHASSDIRILESGQETDF